MNQDTKNSLYALGVDAGQEITPEYLEELSEFLQSYDFMRLGQAVNKGQWESAMMILRRMEQRAASLYLVGWRQQLAGLRQSIRGRNMQQAKQILAAVTARRVRLLEAVRGKKI